MILIIVALLKQVNIFHLELMPVLMVCMCFLLLHLPGSLPGLTRMRLRGGDDVQMTNLQACGPTNSTFGEAEDYLVNIIPASNHDPAIIAIGAAGNCYAANVNMVL